ncbi:hypothetical protein RC98_13570 [Pectobacterium carotovorum subsp. carotovorum]|uniref:hypothetical protein n=1 Tax=Pectobacterium carotovorum TaxID=554 RepID=UPI00057C8AC5|nr:hypothetical protein [Pectobacterium carotovorum]KHT26727.1 hypothetical protein RC98_13570 [Pectobacterium carotovorum subsp. carotovorum]
MHELIYRELFLKKYRAAQLSAPPPRAYPIPKTAYTGKVGSPETGSPVIYFMWLSPFSLSLKENITAGKIPCMTVRQGSGNVIDCRMGLFICL